ncbi:MAG: hypothetical protein QM500_15985 [Methylococcales bacterium]
MEKNFKTKSLVATSLLLSGLALSGCSSSSGGSTPTLDGIYSGSITGGVSGRNGGEKAIIYNNRMMVFSTASNIQQLLESDITVTGSSFSGQLDFYDNSNPIIGTADMTATFVAGQSVTATFTNGSDASITDGAISLAYESDTYKKGSSQERITDSWQGAFGGLGNVVSILVDATGAYTGSDNNCNFTGTIQPADSKVNVYNVSLTTDANCGMSTTVDKLDPSTTYTGFAWTEGATDTSMNFTVSDGIKSRTVILTKN